MRCVIFKRSIFVNVRLSTGKKRLVSQLSLTDVEFHAHTFETTKRIALYNKQMHSKHNITDVKLWFATRELKNYWLASESPSLRLCAQLESGILFC